MFSRALYLVSRSLASQLPSRSADYGGDDSDFDADVETPFDSLDPNSATTRALVLPEILERIGRYLDRHSLFNSLVVSHHFYESLLPVLWFSIQLRVAQPSPKILEQLEKNLWRIRDLTIEDTSTGVGDQDDSGDEDDDNEEEGGRETRGAAFRGYLNRLRSIEILARNDLSLLQYLTLDCGFPANSSSTAVHILNSFGLQWPEQDFFRLTQQCPQLEELKIMGPSKARWDWSISTIDRFAEFCPRVTRIHIDPGYGSDFEDVLLARILETFSGLRSFRVPRCDLGPEAFKALKDRIGQLEELNVAFTRKPGVDGRKLVQLMTRAHNLRYLDASGVSLDPWLFYVTQQQQQQEPEQDVQEDLPEWGRIRPQIATSATSWACRRLEVILIGFATLHVNTRQCQAIYANLSHLSNLRRIHILPNHFPINFESGLEQLATLRQLTHFDVH
ncbi:hypothetical protein BGZ91_004799, partial [Linnemannia elongata]